MAPLGIKFIETTCCSTISPNKKRKIYAIWTWILTFCIYITYHLSRKPISVVKNVLNENCSALVPPHPTNDSHWCDWKPFDGDSSSTLLGTLDSAYLFTYAFGMFFSGFVAERMRLNYFLCIGMLFSGLFTALFGFGKTFGIHVFWYYLSVQLICGIAQSTGWPGVVTAMGNWFGKKKRGFIMGIWNSHTSIGNILGTLIADAFVMSSWDLSFIVPGLLIAFMGIIVYFFLVPDPTTLGLPNPNYEERIIEDLGDHISYSSEEISSLLPNEATAASITSGDHDLPVEQDARNLVPASESPISFWKALKIPGVMEFSFSLFFSKLVSYTFLYWLPHFIYDNTKGSSVTESGNLSTFFDVGGILGGILAGVFSDSLGMPASTCSVMLMISIPLMFAYQATSSGLTEMGTVLFLLPVGVFVNGPYALITTAVSAELGTHQSLNKDAKALSTVTSIIDGTGSLGAAVGPLLAGVLSGTAGWTSVFFMLMGANVISIMCLLRLVKKEVSSFRCR